MHSHTNVILISDQNVNMFPRNSQSHFSTHLAHSLVMNNNIWEVGINSIHMASPDGTYPLMAQHSQIIFVSKHGEFGMTIPTGIISLKELTAFLQDTARVWKTASEVFIVTLSNDAKWGTKLTLSSPNHVIWVDKTIVEWFKLPMSGTHMAGMDKREYFLFPGKLEIFTFDPVQSPLNANMCGEINIELKELKPIIGGSGYKKILASLPYGEKDCVGGTLNKQFMGHEYFPLLTSETTDFEIVLSDKNGKNPSLRPNHPTVVVLNARVKSMNSFIISLSSKDGADLFSQNTPSQFSADLPHPLYFSGKWQVALSSAKISSRFDISTYMSQKDYYFHTSLDDQSSSDEPYETIYLENVELVNQEDFENLNKNPQVIANKMGISFEWKRGQGLFITATKSGDVLLSPKLKEMFSCEHIVAFNLATTSNTALIGIPNMAQISPPNSIFIHTNFSEPIMTGDKHATIIKTLAFKGHSEHDEKRLGESWLYESQHLNFIGVSHPILTHPEISIRDSNGSIVKLKSSSDSSFAFIFSLIN